MIRPVETAKLAEEPRAIAYVSVRLLCDLLDISPSTAWEWVRQGYIPKPVKIGGSSRWRWSDVERKLQDRGASDGEDDPILKASRG